MENQDMKENCLFCHIAEGKVQSKKVYEDELVIGILDINPANAGHVLLMPKEHYMFMPQVPSHVLSKLFIVSKQVSQSVLRAVRSEGTAVFVANGGIAGQRAPHFMVHIIPRTAGDGITLSVPENKIAAEVQATVKSQIHDTLKSVFGIASAAQIEDKSKKEDENKPAEKKNEEKPETPKSKADLDSITQILAGDKRG